MTNQHYILMIADEFRYIADMDYIAARTCYRYELYQQFLWTTLQALEKYLKAILLYNYESKGKNNETIHAKGLRHDVVEAYKRVLSIEDIRFDVTIQSV